MYEEGQRSNYWYSLCVKGCRIFPLALQVAPRINVKPKLIQPGPQLGKSHNSHSLLGKFCFNCSKTASAIIHSFNVDFRKSISLFPYERAYFVFGGQVGGGGCLTEAALCLSDKSAM